MNQLKSFSTGKYPITNIAALVISIGAAGYFQYTEEKKTQETKKSNKNKYLLWALVVLFMIPIMINTLSSEKIPSSSFETDVDSEFRLTVADASRRIRERVAEITDSVSEEIY